MSELRYNKASFQSLAEARKLNKSQKSRLSLMKSRINHISGQDQWNQKKTMLITDKVRTIKTAKSRLMEEKQLKCFKKDQEEYLQEQKQIQVNEQRQLMRKLKTERLEYTRQRQRQNQLVGQRLEEKQFFKQEKDNLIAEQENKFAQLVDQIKREEEEGLQSRYQFMQNKKANTKKIYQRWAKQTQSQAQKFYDKIFKLEKQEMNLLQNLEQTSHNYQHTMDDLRGIQQSSPQQLIEQFQYTLFPTSVQEKSHTSRITLKTNNKKLML